MVVLLSRWASFIRPFLGVSDLFFKVQTIQIAAAFGASAGDDELRFDPEDDHTRPILPPFYGRRDPSLEELAIRPGILVEQAPDDLGRAISPPITREI